MSVEKGKGTQSDNKWHATEIKEQNLGLRNKTQRILRKSPEQNFTVTQMWVSHWANVELSTDFWGRVMTMKSTGSKQLCRSVHLGCFNLVWIKNKKKFSDKDATLWEMIKKLIGRMICFLNFMLFFFH